MNQLLKHIYLYEGKLQHQWLISICVDLFWHKPKTYNIDLWHKRIHLFRQNNLRAGCAKGALEVKIGVTAQLTG